MDAQPVQASGRSGRGLILGKFLPPHRGHQYLADFARQYVGEVTVLVCTLPSDSIPGRLRYEWMKAMLPYDNVKVIHVTDQVPQEPCEHPEFWPIWRQLIRKYEPRRIDFVFASEDYGRKLAEILDARYVPVDPLRELNPVSGTMIRDNPMKHWPMLPSCVRPYFAKRIAIIGPESTGKSTLARELAKAFDSVYAWEFARPWLDPKGGQCDPDDIEHIARGQLATEDAMALHANRVLICDTNLLLTTIWSETLFGSCPEWIVAAARSRRYDAHLLLRPDVPWVDDNQRYFPDHARRKAFFDVCERRLQAWDINYQIIEGGWNDRLAASREAIARVLQANPRPAATGQQGL